MKDEIKDNKPKYLIEKYTDKYRSLYQAIMIDLDIDKESNGNESRFVRSKINPNLTVLLEQEYRNKDMELIERKQLINDNWYFEE